MINPANNSKSDKAIRQLGDRMEDGSYYMGVSETTGTDFYLFLENATDTTKKTADIMTFNEGTILFLQKHQEQATFHGHSYSAQQLKDEIVAAYKSGTADGGIRRLTDVEWMQVYKVLELKSELHELAVNTREKNHWVQTASPIDSSRAYFKSVVNGMLTADSRNYFNDGILLGGYSVPN